MSDEIHCGSANLKGDRKGREPQVIWDSQLTTDNKGLHWLPSRLLTLRRSRMAHGGKYCDASHD